MKFLLKTFTFIFCLALGNTLHAQDCTFTYEQGYNVGCSIAQQANADGCYSMNCSNAFINTIDDFAMCTEYVLGVIDGFAACNTPPPFRDRRGVNTINTNDPSSNDDCIETSPGVWDCP